MKPYLVISICMPLLFYITSARTQSRGIPTSEELSKYEPESITSSPNKEVLISGSHGDAEIVLGWWGWYGMTPHVAKVLDECAEKALADPDFTKYTFEYDAASWKFYDKFYPQVIQKIRKAVKADAWEVNGGTFSIHLPYMVGLESNIRQWVMGQHTINEILGTKAQVFHYQEFLLFPQLPMILTNTGIKHSFYENHLAICGSIRKDWRGVKWWQASDGSTVKAVSDYPGLRVGWPDLLHIRSTPYLFKDYFEQKIPDPVETFNPTEDEFHFDAAYFGDSYGNMASVLYYKTEYELLTAERLAAIVNLLGGPDYSELLQAAWSGLLTMESHGIVYCCSECYCVETGTSLWEAGKYHLQVARKITGDVITKSLNFIAGDMNTEIKGEGVPMVLFNPLAYRYSPYLEKEVTFQPGFAKGIRLLDGIREVPLSVREMEKYEDGSIKRCVLLFKAKNLPAMGVKVLQLATDKAANISNHHTDIKVDRQNQTMENEFIKIQFNKRGIGAIYSKYQDRIILGSDLSMQSRHRYDRTVALELRNTFREADDYKKIGWEVIETDDLHAVAAFNYESNLATHKILLTLYSGEEYMDIRVEHRSKTGSGDVMGISPGERMEKMWLDFYPAFKGNVKCNTVADVLTEQRDFYFSNTWLNFSNEVNGFSILHKGIHGWDKKYATQEWRQKRDYAVSAHLGVTDNEWVPGMVRMNTQFGEDGVLLHEFRLILNPGSNEYELEKASREYLYVCPLMRIGQHKGKWKEKEFIKITSGNAFVSSFYADLTTGKKPAIRFWNPSNNSVDAEFMLGFETRRVQTVQFDGTEKGMPIPFNGRLKILPKSLTTLKIADYKSPDRQIQEEGIFYSNVPFTRKQRQWYFEAPMESYRFIKHHVMYRDSQNNVYMMADPYDEIDVEFLEGSKEADFRIFNAVVTIPDTYKDRNIRLVTLWNTSRQYGVGGCILADNYENRADEPVSLIINGQKLPDYTFDISRYVKYGEDNILRLEVLAEEPPDEVLVKRSSVYQYLTYNIEEGQRLGKVINAGFFEDISRSFLRIGKIIECNTVAEESYCLIKNPDFSAGTLEGWEVKGKVKADNDDNGYGTNFFTRLSGKSNITQQIDIDPGLYYLKINTKEYNGSGNFGIEFPEGETVSDSINTSPTWIVNTILFTVPENVERITIFAESNEGEVLIDDFRIIANKVAKKIPGE